MGGLARDQARARVGVTMRRAFVLLVSGAKRAVMAISLHNRK